MEYVIQKAVELGVYEIIPVEMKYCVVRLDDKKKEKKHSLAYPAAHCVDSGSDPACMQSGILAFC